MILENAAANPLYFLFSNLYLYFSHIDLAWSSLFVIFVKLVLLIEITFGAVKQLTSVIVLFSDFVCLIIL
jgi:hypothetical protein